MQSSPAPAISAQAIMDAIGAAVVVLDPGLIVVAANPAACALFAVSPAEALGRPLSGLGQGRWDASGLERQLEGVIAEGASLADFLFEDDFPGQGRRIFKLDANRLDATGGGILLVFKDVTEAVAADRHKDLLAAELAHRIKNSLSVISAFLSLELKRGLAPSREGYREMLARLAAVAGLYDIIARSNAFGPVDMQSYLGGIANGLRASLVGRDGEIEIATAAEPLAVNAEHAVSLGLLVNELGTNAIKHAFPRGRGRILLAFRRGGEGALTLSVEDDGVGLDAAAGPEANTGLGMRFVEAFVQQLGGTLTRSSGPAGTTMTASLPPSILAS